MQVFFLRADGRTEKAPVSLFRKTGAREIRESLSIASDIKYLLSDGPVRFNELQRRMPEEMTHTTLSRQLKTLENEGLIVRKVYQQIPPRVEYSLSEIGEKFKIVLSSLEIWGNEYIQYLNSKK